MMKTLLPLCLCVFVAIGLFAADVTFNLTDFLGTVETLKRKQAMIEPRNTVRANGNSVVTSEPRFFNTGTNGVFIATNMLDGLYRATVFGLNKTSVFHVNIPATNGAINASDYVTSLDSGVLETEDGIPIDLE